MPLVTRNLMEDTEHDAVGSTQPAGGIPE